MGTVGGADSGGSQPGWLRPQVEQAGLRQYLDVLRERWRILVAALALTLAASGLYLASAEKVYTAQADLLISPVPSDDTLLVSLGLIRQSGEPTRDIETAARIAGSIEVASRASRMLGGDRTPQALLTDVSIEPVAQSNLVAIEGEASTPEEAAELANAYAEAVIEERDEAVTGRIEEILPQLRGGDLGDAPAVGSATDLDAEISRLQFMQAAGDPTTQIETSATPPTGATSPRPMITLGAAIFVGLVLGIGGAFGMQALDPRLRREQQLRGSYSLPILARIPRERGRSQDRALPPGSVSRETSEAYRTLRANLGAASQPGRGQLIMVTGSAPQEGKTTTAINLAASFALGGRRVILIEADLRRPAIGNALGISVETGVVATLLGNAELGEALVRTSQFGPNLRLLLAESHGPAMSELFSLRAAQRLIEEASEAADCVIFDSPPLTAVVDAMPLARRVDDVLLVSRIGLTRLDRLHQLAELLAGNGIDPVGFALVGTRRSRSSYYYESSDDPAGTALDDLPERVRRDSGAGRQSEAESRGPRLAR